MLLDTPLCNFGWKAADFTLEDVQGNTFNLYDQETTKGFLLMFICNHCPYVKGIASRLAIDTQLLMDEGFVVAAIMSNDYQSVPADSPENMQLFAQEHGFAFPYLVDNVQSVAKNYEAVCTPDFFGFNKNLELQYRGRLDNVGLNASEHQTRHTELINAMHLIAETGSGPAEQIASMGCSIKWV